MQELQLIKPDIEFIRNLNVTEILNLKLTDLGLEMKDKQDDENVSACEALFGMYEGESIQDSETIVTVKPLNIRIINNPDERGIIKVESLHVTEVLYKRLFELYESDVGIYEGEIEIETLLMIEDLTNLTVTGYDVRDSLEEEILNNKEITYGELGFLDSSVDGYGHVVVRDRIELLQSDLEGFTSEKSKDTQYVLGDKYLNLDALSRIQVKLIEEVSEDDRGDYIEEQAEFICNRSGIRELIRDSEYRYEDGKGKTISFSPSYGVKISSGIGRKPGFTIETNTISLTFDASLLKGEELTIRNMSKYISPEDNKRIYFNGMNPLLDTIAVLDLGGTKDSLLFDLIFNVMFRCNDYIPARLSIQILHNEFRNWYSKGAINYGQFPFNSVEALNMNLKSEPEVSDSPELDRFLNINLQTTRDNRHVLEPYIGNMSFGIESEIEPYFRELLLYDRYLDSVLTGGRLIIKHRDSLDDDDVFVLRLNEYLRTILNRFTTMDLRRSIKVEDGEKFIDTMIKLMNGTILSHLKVA